MGTHTPTALWLKHLSLPSMHLQALKPVVGKALPRLPTRVVKASAADAAKPVLAAAVPEEGKFLGISSFTWQKIIPLGLMFFW